MTQIENLEAAALFLGKHMYKHVIELTDAGWHMLYHTRKAIEAQIKALIS